MPLEIEYCPHGAPRTSLPKLRTEMEASGHALTADTLVRVPYEQLNLCPTATAGAIACSVEEAAREQFRRRRRFLSMDAEGFRDSKRYLQVEGMYEDVLRERQLLLAPTWETLRLRQKVWFKLTCLQNHADVPHARLADAQLLLRECALWGDLPKDVATAFRKDVERLTAEAKHGMKAEYLSRLVQGMASNVLDFLPEPEQNVCAAELLRDYTCTSDCFRGVRN